MQKIGIALPSCIRQRALMLHWPGSWLLVGLERPKQVIPTETTGATDKERNGSSGPLYSVHAPFGERVSAGLLVQRSNYKRNGLGYKTNTSRMRFSVQCFITGFWLLNIAPALSGTLMPGASATPYQQDVQKLYISVGAPTTIGNVIKSGPLSRLRQFNGVEIEEEIGSADYANFVTAMELHQRFRVGQGVLKEADTHPGHSEVGHFHTVVPEHPLHAVRVCLVGHEAFPEIISIGKIQQFFADPRDPPREMEPVQAMLTFFPNQVQTTPRNPSSPADRIVRSVSCPRPRQRRIACTRCFAR